MQLPVSDFLETADFIGAKLCRDAIWASQRCSWFGVPVPATQRSVKLQAQSVCGSDFYSGTSGIAVFLSRLFAATGERVFRITAEGAIRQALSRLDDFPRDSRISFYGGLTGVAYGLFEIADSCGIDKFHDMGLLVLEEISGEEASSCDAWTVGVLLRMHERHHRDFLLRLAIRCGEELLKRPPEHAGTSAPANGTNVASAMVELFRVTGEKKYREVTEQILLNQPGEHEMSGGNEIQDARAHLRAFELLGDRLYEKRVRDILQTIQLRTDPPSDTDLDFTLSRGVTGEADTLLDAARILGDKQLRATAERVGNRGIEQYKKHDLPWPCGSPAGLDSPSFMAGLAGIGYFYLRLHDSSHVPSVLLA